MTNEKAISIIKNAFSWYEDNARESEEEDWSGQHEALKMAIKALEPKPMEKFDDVKTHIRRLAGDYKCWDNRLTWEEALELNRMLEAQQNSNEFFNFDAPIVKKSDAVSREAVQDLISRWLSDYLLDETREALETINYKIGDMPSVTPRTNLAETSQDCISILNRIMEYTYGMLTAEKYGLQHLIKSMMDEMSGGGEDG